MNTIVRVSLSLALLFTTVVGLGHAQDGAAVVTVAVNPTAGPILADANGMTLYTWVPDAPGVSHCYDQCAVIWPPLLTLGDPIATPGLPGTLAVIQRDDGTTQVTYDNMPLYYFARDLQPGDVNGIGN